jgi:hypothetical protein
MLESFSIKVKVLGGGFGLWLGDNISILSMVEREHLLYITCNTLVLSPHFNNVFFLVDERLECLRNVIF